MAKRTQSTGDTREVLIKDAKAKFAEADDALKAAKAEFEAAGNDTDKAAAQVKINAASEQVERYAKLVETLLKEPADNGAANEDDDDRDTRDFIVGGNGTIRLNGRDYAEGETISLTKKDWEQLAPLGVLAGKA